jgi:hypothetical protein
MKPTGEPPIATLRVRATEEVVNRKEALWRSNTNRKGEELKEEEKCTDVPKRELTTRINLITDGIPRKEIPSPRRRRHDHRRSEGIAIAVANGVARAHRRSRHCSKLFKVVHKRVYANRLIAIFIPRLTLPRMNHFVNGKERGRSMSLLSGGAS